MWCVERDELRQIFSPSGRANQRFTNVRLTGGSKLGVDVCLRVKRVICAGCVLTVP